MNTLAEKPTVLIPLQRIRRLSRWMSLAFSSNHAFTLFFAGLVWLMADVIEQGHVLAAENESFV